MSKTTYLRRKEQGLCTKCGGEIEQERKGKTMCGLCTAKDTAYKRDIAEFCRELRICPRCHKNKLVGDEKNCPECRAKNYISLERQKKNNPKSIAVRDANHKAHRKILYQERKTQGLCVTCGNPLMNSDLGLVNCRFCREKHKKYKLVSVKPRSEYKSSIWKRQGLCPFCGDTLYGKHGLCKKHYDMQIASHDYKSMKGVAI